MHRGELGGIDMVEWHHAFCKAYGWMSPKEFAEELTIPAFLNMAEKISRDAEEEKKAYDKINKGKGKWQ